MFFGIEKKFEKCSARGFTLIELMVSLTVFSIVMLISVGTLLTLIDANAKAQALYTATTNLSFALDTISRDIRTSHHYYCINNINEGNHNGYFDGGLPTAGSRQNCNSGEAIAFVRDWDNSRVGYRRNGDTIQQKIGAGNWESMTSSDVVIEQFNIKVVNAELNDNEQPTIDLIIKGYVNNGLETNTDFHIQTHIVSRRLDII